jgi:repressor LexA
VLTQRQNEILQFIVEYLAANRCAPSDREIALGVGLRSASTANYHLQKLKAAGYLTYEKGAPRTVRVLPPLKRNIPKKKEKGAGRAERKVRKKPGFADSAKVVWVPVVGQIAAGEPIPPLDSIEDRFPLPREVVGAEDSLFILRVVGDSMVGAGIFPNDWVVVRRLYERPQNGDIVAVLLSEFEDEGTVKTYQMVEGRAWLMPQNPSYLPISGAKATIHGKVVAVLRQV